MTELLITPNYDKKTAKFKGTVAAGETVRVKIVNARDIDIYSLRLRVMEFNGKTLALFERTFPVEEEGAEINWVNDGEHLTCNLDLNTVEMQSAVCGMCERELLVVLDDPKNNILHFKSECTFQGWPKLKGGESPHDLTGFPKLIDDWVRQLGNMVVSANAVNGGVEILLWDGKGEKPKPVKIYNGDATKAEEAAKRASDSAAESLKNTKEAKEAAVKAAEESKAAEEAARSALNGIAKKDIESSWDLFGEEHVTYCGEVTWFDAGILSEDSVAGYYLLNAEAEYFPEGEEGTASIPGSQISPVLVSKDIYCESFEVEVEFSADGVYFYHRISGHRDVYAKKGEPYVTKSYVDKKSGGGGGGSYVDKAMKLATQPEGGEERTAEEIFEQIDSKRDKTDNIAVVDSMEFTKWKFSCDVPEIQAVLEGYSSDGFWSDGYWFIGCPDVSGYMVTSDSWQGAEGAVSLSNDSVYQDQNTGAMVAVTATRERTVLAKAHEPYVTPTGVKALVPKTELHALAPEVTDTMVTLKPVDGAANWVEGVVGAGSFVETFSFKHVASVAAWNEDDDVVADFDAVLELDNTNSVIVNKLDSQTTEVILRATKNVDLYDLKDSTKHRGYIYEGAVLEFELAEPTDFTGTVPFRRELDASYWGEEAYIWDPVPNAVSIGVPDGHSLPGFYAVSAGSNPRITLPGSTGHARSFSLALVTDARDEMGLVWEGGDIIEAFPGAKNIVPSTGEIVFDIKEVAPGKMLVNRVPGASGGAVTLTAPNGRVAELTVGDDLVLEVKEK